MLKYYFNLKKLFQFKDIAISLNIVQETLELV